MKKLPVLSILLIITMMAQTMAAAQPNYGRNEEDAATSTDQLEQLSTWFNQLPHQTEKHTHLHFYFHDIVTARHPTVLRVAQSPLTKKSKTQFGFLNILDDKLTSSPDPRSHEMGRAQGMYGSSDQNELAYVTALNFVFTSGRFKGSSLSVLGRNAILDRNRELPVVGGTGRFRLARGVAVLNTVRRNATTRNAVVEYNVFVIHY